MSDEEDYAEWSRRVYTEAADTQGFAMGFWIFCIANFPDALREFTEYDRQMRETGLFVTLDEGGD